MTSDGYVEIPRNHCRLRMFDHGLKNQRPQTAKISVEPVVSIGTLSRLVEDLGWPLSCIASQMDRGAFDMTLYSPGSALPVVQCEIKVRRSEVDAMAEYFVSVINEQKAMEPKRANWNKKVAAIYRSPPKLVWLLAPGPHERVFEINSEHSALTIAEVLPESLRFDRVFTAA